MHTFKEYFTKNLERFIDEWKTFLRFKSISSIPEYSGECLSCAEWLQVHLRTIGFQNVELLPTCGKPVVYAHYEGAPGAPRLLYYGHYDVYQINPLIPWKFGAFEPTLLNGRMYSRGAQDNKGQTFFFLKALETLIEKKLLHCSITLLIEGEEETTTSSGLMSLLPSIRDRIKADALIVCDTECKDLQSPSIVLGLRGIIHFSFRIEGLKSDLHSGAHGGVVKNPGQEMVKLLATLHNNDGSIAVQGFYDGITELTSEERDLVNDTSVDMELYEKDVGVAPIGGEHGKYSFVERRGLRPTLEINGVYAGYIGPGVKTIIPSYSNAKLTARLVAGQDPATCLAAIESHIKKYAPQGLTLTLEEQGCGGSGVRINPHSTIVAAGKKVLKSIFKKDPIYSWEGSSIPVVSELVSNYTSSALLVGFGLEEDRVHAADESFSLQQLENGYLYVCALLQKLSQTTFKTASQL